MKTALVVPASPSVTVASPIDTVGSVSSSVIVPTPCASAIVAFEGRLRLTKKLSVASSSRSPLTMTVTVCVVTPAAKFSVPAAAAKSPGATAESLAVAKLTDTARPLTAESVAVKVALTVPELPSVTVTSSIESEGSGSSSVIVPRPKSSAIVAFEAPREADREALVYLITRVTYKGDVHGLRNLARREGQQAARRGVVAGGDRRAVGGRVVDGHGLAAGRAQGDREGRVRGALELGDVVDRECRRRIVVRDRADGLAVAERRVRGARQVEQEAFVRLVQHVAVDEHRDRLRGVAGREVERPARRRVVSRGDRRVICRRVGDRDVAAADRAEGHRERCLRGARIAFGDADVGDRQRRLGIVVGDRPDALGVAEGGVRRFDQPEEERLVRLVEHVADHVDGDRLRGLTGGEVEEERLGHEIERAARCCSRPSRRRR